MVISTVVKQNLKLKWGPTHFPGSWSSLLWLRRLFHNKPAGVWNNCSFPTQRFPCLGSKSSSCISLWSFRTSHSLHLSISLWCSAIPCFVLTGSAELGPAWWVFKGNLRATFLSHLGTAKHPMHPCLNLKKYSPSVEKTHCTEMTFWRHDSWLLFVLQTL